MRRLYQKIYLTIVASLVLVVLVSGGVWRFGSEFSPARQAFEIVGAVAITTKRDRERTQARHCGQNVVAKGISERH